jgi:hypothetical protein
MVSLRKRKAASANLDNARNNLNLHNSNRVNMQRPRSAKGAVREDAAFSELLGKKIIEVFKKNNDVNQAFSQGLTLMRSQYPTNSHINKFIVGLSCEYLFCDALKTHGNVPVYLCTDDAVRNDVFVHDRTGSDQWIDRAMANQNKNIRVGSGGVNLEYSLKYKSPNARNTGVRVPNVRLVNTQGGGFDMDNIKEDVFLIVPNPLNNKGQANGSFGKLVFIPHGRFGMYESQGIHALSYKKDGIDLVAPFLNAFMEDPRNEAYRADIDVGVAPMEELDSIKILTNAALQQAERDPLDETIFLCRVTDAIKKRSRKR